FLYNLTSKKLGEDTMGTLATTKMSSKGQVVIPEEVRKRLNLKTGAQFVVIGENDVVILKAISPPSLQEFDALIAKAKREAKTAGLKQADIQEAILKVRGRK
ncbi:MAG TPA: AbrB/MazE/SpoVT family DNA-binding domain-containing protein, partial [Desulfuromonadales bacterium]|nr:AbrB/MazE/SpoVT family DNA-binding domain-containing protein [Desulfuromonadales bacterium]